MNTRPPFPQSAPLSTFRLAARAWPVPGILSACLLVACAPVKPVAGPSPVVTPAILADPGEPVNRSLWAVNRGLLCGVLQPAGRVYRAVVPKPVRGSINNFSRNITYPGRLINHALQGRWTGASDESLRFLTNSTFGIAGLFDVATRWNIPESDANFGQTFVRWGWQPQNYIMVPIGGPADECHLLGMAADKAVEPWNYVDTYYLSTCTLYNRLSDSVEGSARMVRSDADPYATLKYAWSYTSKESTPDWSTTGPPDLATLQTMGVARITLKDSAFPERGHQMSVRIPATGRRLKFNIWLQPKPAPLAYLTPGLGSHRLTPTNLSLAECLYQNGFSVVSTTSVFHPEFMEQAATTAVPAYPKVDAADLLGSLTAIDGMLMSKFPGRFGQKALIGCSMGGYQALYLAANEARAAADSLRFDRYVAIDTPVDLRHGIACLDRFCNAPMAWPEAKRQERVNNLALKAAKLATMPATPGAIPPLDGTETQFIIGLTFRLTLRDAIFSSQWRHNLGVLKTPLSKWRREPCYGEIMGYSYQDYFNKFALPYYHTQGVRPADFAREANLRTYASTLHKSNKVRAIVNRNDFLLKPTDLDWLQATFGKSRLKVMPDGGHLGNLASPEVQSALIDALSGLR